MTPIRAFFSIIFSSNLSNSNLLLLLLSCPTAGPGGEGARALKLTPLNEMRREVGERGWKRKGKEEWDSEGGKDTWRRLIKKVCMVILPLSLP